jgi:hypothetical protein
MRPVHVFLPAARIVEAKVLCFVHGVPSPFTIIGDFPYIQIFRGRRALRAYSR